ncbi:hypothetical protein H2202_011060, partial [Exophiala xenobiotica]
IVAVHGLGAHPDDTWSKKCGEGGEARWVNCFKRRRCYRQWCRRTHHAVRIQGGLVRAYRD